MDEASLVLRYNLGEDVLKSVGYHFGDQLVPYVTKGYQTKSVEGFGSFLLRDEGKDCRVSVASDFLTVLGF